MIRPRYIDLPDFDEARELKWKTGKKEHRKPGEKFTGDPVEELYQELIDAYNLTQEMEQDGVSLPGFRTTFRNMAANLQNRREELKRRI